MRTVQRHYQFRLDRADRVRFKTPNTTRARLLATTEIGAWSTVTLLVNPVVNGVSAGFPSAKTLTAATPTAAFTDDEFAGVNEIEVYHAGATTDAGTYLTIELTTEDTQPTPIAVAPFPSIPFDGTSFGTLKL